MSDKFFTLWFVFVGALAFGSVVFFGWVTLQLLRHFGVV